MSFVYGYFKVLWTKSILSTGISFKNLWTNFEKIQDDFYTQF